MIRNKHCARLVFIFARRHLLRYQCTNCIPPAQPKTSSFCFIYVFKRRCGLSKRCSRCSFSYSHQHLHPDRSETCIRVLALYMVPGTQPKISPRCFIYTLGQNGDIREYWTGLLICILTKPTLVLSTGTVQFPLPCPKSRYLAGFILCSKAAALASNSLASDSLFYTSICILTDTELCIQH